MRDASCCTWHTPPPPLIKQLKLNRLSFSVYCPLRRHFAYFSVGDGPLYMTAHMTDLSSRAVVYQGPAQQSLQGNLGIPPATTQKEKMSESTRTHKHTHTCNVLLLTNDTLLTRSLAKSKMSSVCCSMMVECPDDTQNNNSTTMTASPPSASSLDVSLCPNRSSRGESLDEEQPTISYSCLNLPTSPFRGGSEYVCSGCGEVSPSALSMILSLQLKICMWILIDQRLRRHRKPRSLCCSVFTPDEEVQWGLPNGPVVWQSLLKENRNRERERE